MSDLRKRYKEVSKESIDEAEAIWRTTSSVRTSIKDFCYDIFEKLGPIIDEALAEIGKRVEDCNWLSLQKQELEISNERKDAEVDLLRQLADKQLKAQTHLIDELSSLKELVKLKDARIAELELQAQKDAELMRDAGIRIGELEGPLTRLFDEINRRFRSYDGMPNDLRIDMLGAREVLGKDGG